MSFEWERFPDNFHAGLNKAREREKERGRERERVRERERERERECAAEGVCADSTVHPIYIVLMKM